MQAKYAIASTLANGFVKRDTEQFLIVNYEMAPSGNCLARRRGISDTERHVLTLNVLLRVLNLVGHRYYKFSLQGLLNLVP
eukprot:SAG31_NODE_486_length_15001_cov_8.454405_6_plen_81_part_00